MAMSMDTRENNEVTKLIETLPSHIKEIVVRLRELIFKASPEMMEEIKWSSRFIHKTDWYVILRQLKIMLT
ncbi:hypothetical protein [Halalkalibacter alkalisediminis]|uniref:DUF1801 domain-containing protein n=1 Tax=Halalkalibacter alkalisediminis TaxID=935616 RepID=A0ABV6NQ18_9BACI|nr:hypothetical protein [Halalkalibacter alkalisediminis]